MKNYLKLILIILNDETEFKDDEIASNYVFQIKPDFLNTPGNSIYIYMMNNL